jgi:hypothetical protein
VLGRGYLRRPEVAAHPDHCHGADEGEGAYSALKGIAIANGIASVIVAIILWYHADAPHLVFDGGVEVSTAADPTIVLEGFLVLAEGVVVSILLWAVGTVGQHVVAVRRQVAPVQPVVARLPAAPLVPGGDVRPDALPPGYAIVINDLGGVDPASINQIVRKYTDIDVPMNVIVPGGVLVAGLGFASAGPVRGALRKKGVDVEMREVGT